MTPQLHTTNPKPTTSLRRFNIPLILIILTLLSTLIISTTSTFQSSISPHNTLSPSPPPTPTLPTAPFDQSLQLSALASEASNENLQVKFSGWIKCEIVKCTSTDDTIDLITRLSSYLQPFERVDINLWVIPTDQTEYQYVEMNNLQLDSNGTVSIHLPVTSEQLVTFTGTFYFKPPSIQLTSNYTPTTLSNPNHTTDPIPYDQPGYGLGQLRYKLIDPDAPIWFQQFWIVRTVPISQYLLSTIDDTLPILPDYERRVHAHLYTNFTQDDENAYFYLYIPPIHTSARSLEIVFSSAVQPLMSILLPKRLTCYLNGHAISTMPIDFITISDGLLLAPFFRSFQQHASLSFSCPIPIINLKAVQNIIFSEKSTIFVQVAISNRTSTKADPNWLPHWAYTVPLLDFTQIKTTTTSTLSSTMDSTQQLQQNIQEFNTNEHFIQQQQQQQHLSQQHLSQHSHHFTQSTEKPILPRYNHVMSGSGASGDPTLATCTFSLTFSDLIPYHYVPFNKSLPTVKPLSFSIRLRGANVVDEKSDPWWIIDDNEVSGQNVQNQQNIPPTDQNDSSFFSTLSSTFTTLSSTLSTTIETPFSNTPAAMIYFTQDFNRTSVLYPLTTVLSRFALTPVKNIFHDLTFPIIHEFYHEDGDDDEKKLNNDSIHNDNNFTKTKPTIPLQYLYNDTISITLHARLKKQDWRDKQWLAPQCVLRFNDPLPIPNDSVTNNNNNNNNFQETDNTDVHFKGIYPNLQRELHSNLIPIGHNDIYSQQQYNQIEKDEFNEQKQQNEENDNIDHLTFNPPFDITQQHPTDILDSYPLAPAAIVTDWTNLQLTSETIHFELYQINQTSTQFNITLNHIATDVVFLTLQLESYSDFYFQGDNYTCYFNGIPIEANLYLDPRTGPTQVLEFALSDTIREYISQKQQQQYFNINEFQHEYQQNNNNNLHEPFPYGTTLHVWCPTAYININSTSFQLFPNIIPSLATTTKTTSYNEKYDINLTSYQYPAILRIITYSSSTTQSGSIIFYPFERNNLILTPIQKLLMFISILTTFGIVICALLCRQCYKSFGSICCPIICCCFYHNKNDLTSDELNMYINMPPLTTYNELHEFELELNPQNYINSETEYKLKQDHYAQKQLEYELNKTKQRQQIMGVDKNNNNNNNNNSNNGQSSHTTTTSVTNNDGDDINNLGSTDDTSSFTINTQQQDSTTTSTIPTESTTTTNNNNNNDNISSKSNSKDTTPTTSNRHSPSASSLQQQGNLPSSSESTPLVQK